jgi:hypothetical protein
VRLVGYSHPDFHGIGLKEEEVELWISYFTTTLNRWGVRCAPLDWGTPAATVRTEVRVKVLASGRRWLEQQLGTALNLWAIPMRRSLTLSAAGVIVKQRSNNRPGAKEQLRRVRKIDDVSVRCDAKNSLLRDNDAFHISGKGCGYHNPTRHKTRMENLDESPLSDEDLIFCFARPARSPTSVVSVALARFSEGGCGSADREARHAHDEAHLSEPQRTQKR